MARATKKQDCSVTEQAKRDDQFAQHCGAILKAFETNQYLNAADFRLVTGGKGKAALMSAVSHLITAEYIVELNVYDDDLDGIETGSAETIHERFGKYCPKPGYLCSPRMTRKCL